MNTGELIINIRYDMEMFLKHIYLQNKRIKNIYISQPIGKAQSRLFLNLVVKWFRPVKQLAQVNFPSTFVGSKASFQPGQSKRFYHTFQINHFLFHNFHIHLLWKVPLVYGFLSIFFFDQFNSLSVLLQAGRSGKKNMYIYVYIYMYSGIIKDFIIVTLPQIERPFEDQVSVTRSMHGQS